MAGATAAGTAGAAGAQAASFTDAEIQTIYERYAAFGDKASGGAGDNACGAWLADELMRSGYAIRRQPFQTPAFDAERTDLVAGSARAEVVPQALVRTTPMQGIRGPLRLAGTGMDMTGAIALVVLPYARWSAVSGQVETRVKAQVAAGAAAVVLVTTGPTGEALALNAPAEGPLFQRPVAVLAPKDAQPFIEAATTGQAGTLTVTGRPHSREAYNLVASLRPQARRTLVISTPRSGWFTCVGERGPGLAVWLLLARWAATATTANVELLCTSGHEYDNHGGAQYLEHLAPKPDRTALWVHLGANVAARDWHEGARGLQPLPGADSQRYLLASPAILPAASALFAGQPGLEQAYPATVEASAGELTNILKAGYSPAVGVFGGHRHHHAPTDGLNCVVPAHARMAAESFVRLIKPLVA